MFSPFPPCRGIPFRSIFEATKIDPWFLRQIEELVVFEKDLGKHTIQDLPTEVLREAKRKGYADRQIAHILNCLESEVRSPGRGLSVFIWGFTLCSEGFLCRIPWGVLGQVFLI